MYCRLALLWLIDILRYARSSSSSPENRWINIRGRASLDERTPNVWLVSTIASVHISERYISKKSWIASYLSLQNYDLIVSTARWRHVKQKVNPHKMSHNERTAITYQITGWWILNITLHNNMLFSWWIYLVFQCSVIVTETSILCWHMYRIYWPVSIIDLTSLIN